MGHAATKPDKVSMWNKSKIQSQKSLLPYSFALNEVAGNHSGVTTG